MSARPRFRLTRRKVTASWLTEGEGFLVGYSLDLIMDAFVQRVRLGLLARFPQTAPADAIAAIGRDRRVLRGINESLPAYVKRLITWLDDRRTAGNPYTLLTRLAEYIQTPLVIRIVDARGNWYTRDTLGNFESLFNTGNWDWDSHTAPAGAHFDGSPSQRWSRFWVVLYPPTSLWHALDLPGWGSVGPWGDPSNTGTWGSSAPREHVESIRALISDWKPAGTRCVNVIVAFDPASFDPLSTPGPGAWPDGYWGRWSKNVGGVQVPARLNTARYWDGV